MRPGAFVARGEAQARIGEWLVDGRRALALRGSAGTGKTTLVRQLDAVTLDALAPAPARWTAALHRCRFSVSESRVPTHAIELLAQQLATIDGYAEELMGSAPVPITITGTGIGTGSTGVVIHTLSLAEEDPAAAARRAFSLPLRSLAQQSRLGPVLVVIDALDEAAVESLPNLMTELAVAIGTSETLPDVVRLLVTTRPMESILERLSVAGFESLDLDVSGPGDVRRYVEQAVKGVGAELELPADELVDLVSHQAGGNFLVAEGLIANVTAAPGLITREDVLRLPSTLSSQYQARVVHLLGQSPEPGLTLLGVFTVARRPLDEHELAEVSGVALDAVRTTLERLTPLLAHDDAPPSRRRYELFHPSFARFLQDRDDAGLWWRDEAAQHVRINAALTEAAERGWDALSDYGVRYAPVHAMAAGGRWEATTWSRWVRAAIHRLGSSATVATLAEVDALPQAEDSIETTLIAALIGLEVRDRARYLAEPGVASLLIRAHGIDATLSDLGALPEADWHSVRPLIEVYAEMVRQGNVETVDRLLASMPLPRRIEIAGPVIELVAEEHPAAVLTLLPHVDDVRGIPSLCEALARHDDTVRTAVAIADGDARSLMALCEVLGRRDPTWALHLVATAESRWEVDDWGVDKTAIGPTERRLRLAEKLVDDQPTAAMEVFEEARSDLSLNTRAVLGLVRGAVRADPARALELASSFSLPDETAEGLALAVAAQLGGDIAAEADRRWRRLAAAADAGEHEWRSAFEDSAQIIAAGVADLEGVRDHATASAIAADVLDRLVERLLADPPDVEEHENAAGTVAAAVAVLEPRRGKAIADRLDRALDDGVTHGFSHPMIPVVERVLPIDAAVAWELCDAVQAPWEEPNWRPSRLRASVMRHVAELSPEQARGLLSARLHPRLRAYLSGVLAAAAPQLDPASLLEHLPGLAETPGAAERCAAFTAGIDAWRSERARAATMDSLQPGAPLPESAPEIRALVGGLEPAEKATTLVELARRGLLAEPTRVLEELIVAAKAQIDGPDWAERDRWRPVLHDGAAVFARIDPFAAIDAVLALDVPGVLLKALTVARPIDVDEVVERFVDRACDKGSLTWLILGKVLVTVFEHPPPPDAPVWERLPPDAADVVRAVLLLRTDEDQARQRFAAAMGGDRGAWFDRLAVDILERRQPTRAIELARGAMGVSVAGGFAELARRDRADAWGRATDDEQSATAMAAVIREVARTDWMWAAGRLDDMNVDQDEALEGLIDALPVEAAANIAACDVLAEFLVGHDDMTKRRLVIMAAARAERLTPRLASTIIRGHMRQDLHYAGDDLDVMARIAAVAGGERGVRTAADLLAALADQSVR